jgi:hypothetical protein
LFFAIVFARSHIKSRITLKKDQEETASMKKYESIPKIAGTLLETSFAAALIHGLHIVPATFARCSTLRALLSTRLP